MLSVFRERYPELFPESWKLNNSSYNIKYYTEECKTKCVCSEEEQVRRRSLCSSFHFNWKLDDYYDLFIVKNRVLCELFEEISYLSSSNDKEKNRSQQCDKIKEIIMVCGPYPNEILQCSSVPYLASAQIGIAIRKFGGLDHIKNIISTEIRKRKPKYSPTLPKSMLNQSREPFSTFNIVYSGLKRTPILFTNCSGYEVASLYHYLDDLYMELKWNDKSADFQTLRYAMRKTYLQVESHLEIQSYIEAAKKNVYQIVSNVCVSENMDMMNRDMLLNIFEYNSMDFVWGSGIIPCGDILYTDVEATWKKTSEQIHYPNYEEAYIYSKLLDYDIDDPPKKDSYMSLKSNTVTSGLRKRKEHSVQEPFVPNVCNWTHNDKVST
ncbi:hypothetical protein NCAS_0F00100 [Naumovozyma castellii]|uniref:Uncharacterized protein n=1 Tax=Naumovozyma castellii TaxID=27288 RepID=G0VG74_NAUCA|nr:hypothetical protein NCAS_0F00100 [Naumovozyma castellii CBS 4309]CCC70494.1 hypothetical protein NCAS_0F00100 [Naumovozyma castellii CBS 4309]